MAHVVVFNRLAFQKRKTDANGNPTVEPDGDEEIVTKGNRVPDYVDLATLSALETAGMVVAVGDDTKPIVEEVGPIVPIPTAPVYPPTGPQPVLVDAASTPPADDEDDLGPEAPAGQPVDQPVDQATTMAPRSSDSRKAWEDYAVAKGMSREAAESYPNKTDLIEAVNAR